MHGPAQPHLRFTPSYRQGSSTPRGEQFAAGHGDAASQAASGHPTSKLDTPRLRPAIYNPASHSACVARRLGSPHSPNGWRTFTHVGNGRRSAI